MFVLRKVEVSWLLLMVCTCFVSCRQVNVAINKRTSTTSGVLLDWHPSGAVDGDHVTLDSPASCFHSVRAPADLTVDLGRRYQLYNITVYLRNGYNERTENSIIYVDKDYNKACYTFPSTISDNPTRLTCNETARYVTIRNPGISGILYEDSLNICEVEIYACTAGYRGVECEVECHCDKCDRWTGICNTTCRPGWEGKRCERACNKTYGTNCTYSCDARHCSTSSSSCDAVNGKCDSGCLPGWIGQDCITECPSSTYGPNCSKNCTNRNCMDNSTCDPMTGSCSLGCQPGWKTTDCTKECEVSEEFGPNCSFPCNARHCLTKSNCYPINGTCDYGCKIGWEGPQCLQALEVPDVTVALESPTPDAGTIAFSTTVGVLVVIIVILAVLLISNIFSSHAMDIVRWLLWTWVCTCFASCTQVNVALNKNASTTAGVYVTATAWDTSGALDGDHISLDSPTSCFHSARAPSDWTVDLGQQYQLYNIIVYIREGYGRRIAKSSIYVDNNQTRVCYTFPSTISDHMTHLTCNETARYVTIRNPGESTDGFLNICEVEVYACTVGYRDVDCEVACHCDVCDRWTGICNNTCDPGWEGKRCDRACKGTYGYNCTNSCDARHCGASSSCDPINGTCDYGCLDGWIRHDCITKCPSATYGPNCSKHCANRSCGGNSSCDHVRGSCELGCKPGWKTIDCTKECEEGEEFGPNCSGSCNARKCLNQSSCDPVNGTCYNGCEMGWEGLQCLQALSEKVIYDRFISSRYIAEWKIQYNNKFGI